MNDPQEVEAAFEKYLETMRGAAMAHEEVDDLAVLHGHASVLMLRDFWLEATRQQRDRSARFLLTHAGDQR